MAIGTREKNRAASEERRAQRQAARAGGAAIRAGRLRLIRQLIAGMLVFMAIAVIWATNIFLSERFTEATRNRAEVRQALYTGQLLSELQRTSVVPLLLARDPELIKALVESRYMTTSQRLISAQTDIGASAIQLIDLSGRVVAATDRTKLGSNMRANEGFLQAQRNSITIFSTALQDNGAYEFAFSRPVYSAAKMVGVIMVAVPLGQFENAWAGESDAVAITDSTGRIILATEPRWRGLTMEEALAVRSAPSAIQRALQATADWTLRAPDAYLKGVGVMRTETRIPFRGWRMLTYTTYDSIRDRVNAVLALEIMGFALLLALIFYALSRRARVETANVRRESAELRLLNTRLQREIAEREKVQKDLASAEQTLAQSSKLAALGEMSASVSHELNQPLAAMKTYLAGALLLLQRHRVDEAMASFQRIDDLIERMGAITRQLKSYARKGGEAFEPIDVRESVSAALTLMEPTLRNRDVRITRTLPRQPVMIMADRIRMEQVIINLLRNALDATKEVPSPQVDIHLMVSDKAILTVSDNGEGIAELDSLFEPFYTTKKPGDGVGLGLAISSGIVTDFGGRLRARDGAAEGGKKRGAVFEVELPLLDQKNRAAE